MVDSIYRKGSNFCNIGIVNLFLFNFLLFMTLFSMYRTILQEPGYVCEEYRRYFSLDSLDDNPVLVVSNFDALFVKDYDISNKDFIFKFFYYTRDLSKQSIFKNKFHCVFCRIIRPERTHHCRKCKRCILKMDHHCNILNTCIGYYNYKLYIIFLFFTILTLAYTTITMIDGLILYYTIHGWQDTTCKIVTISFVILVLFFLSVLELFISHMMYISRGVTTIEYEGHNGNIDKGGSFYSNLKEVFRKENVLYWLWPSCIEF
jgi:hypothetical protein